MKTNEQLARECAALREKIEDAIDRHTCRNSGVIINDRLLVNDILAAITAAQEQQRADIIAANAPEIAKANAALDGAREDGGREDGARLDWLERFLQLGNSSIFTTITGKPMVDEDFVHDGENIEVWSHPYCIGYEVETENRGCYRWQELGEGKKRLRQAIDAARSKEGQR